MFLDYKGLVLRLRTSLTRDGFEISMLEAQAKAKTSHRRQAKSKSSIFSMLRKGRSA